MRPHLQSLLEKFRSRSATRRRRRARLRRPAAGRCASPRPASARSASTSIPTRSPSCCAGEDLHQDTSPAERVAAARATGARRDHRLRARRARCDALIICVPTPLDAVARAGPQLRHRHHRGARAASARRAARLPRKHHLPRHHRRGARAAHRRRAASRVGEDFFLVYSPEREDPGNPQLHDTQPSRRSCGGATAGLPRGRHRALRRRRRPRRAGQLDCASPR